jgi:hypothetical protein
LRRGGCQLPGVRRPASCHSGRDSSIFDRGWLRGTSRPRSVEGAALPDRPLAPPNRPLLLQEGGHSPVLLEHVPPLNRLVRPGLCRRKVFSCASSTIPSASWARCKWASAPGSDALAIASACIHIAIRCAAIPGAFDSRLVCAGKVVRSACSPRWSHALCCNPAAMP